MSDSPLEAALLAARPRALAALSRFFRDLDRAEDAFQEACLRALKHWPVKGIPNNPAAWLALVGRNAGLDTRRRQQRFAPLEASPSEPVDPTDSNDWAEAVDHREYRDDVLRLLFTCCHPSLRREHQVALALKVVVGLTTDEIASAFLIKTRTLEQRLTRAKRRVSAARIPYVAPDAEERARRLHAVSTSLYLLFNEGYSASDGPNHVRGRLCEEAIRLVRLLAELFPEDPETQGLLALCLLLDARRPARLDGDGEGDGSGDLVLLEHQDRTLWNRAQIDEGCQRVEAALRQGAPGPFQVQAAIAAVHASAPTAEATDWAEIDRLYRVLERLQPSPVVTLNRAVARAKVAGPGAALELLEPVTPALEGTFHFHGVRGALQLEVGHREAARRDLEQALNLARTPAERRHLEGVLAGATAEGPDPEPDVA